MIVEMIGERVVVVTHGGVIRALHEWASLGTGHRAGRILNSQCITLIGSRQIGHQIMGGCQSSEWSRVLRLGFWWRSNFRLLDLPLFLLFVLPQVRLLLFSQIYQCVLFCPWVYVSQGFSSGPGPCQFL
ncbi:hypothetical protein Hanom_Chr17g01577671 [Helianthus anomalus]